MNRRMLLKRSAQVGGFAIVAPGILLQEACKPKDLSFYDQTLLGVLRELQPLLPNAADLIAKGIKLIGDFDAAYVAGKFADATALFANLDDVLIQIAADAGVNNPTVKIALVVAGVALRAIAVLLAGQASQPAVVAAMRTRSAAQEKQMALIVRLSDSVVVDRLFAAVR
jgi:hypothetical protein